jgi:hypothetical protein
MSTERRWRPSKQCHRLCLSLRCDFTLEPFTRGLASEDADQHAQRFIVVIPRRFFSYYASPSIALLSRPDHNAATPFASLMFAFELSTSAIAPLAAITQLPDEGRSAGAVKPAARQGRSEAEWLDRAENRRTIRRRDGRSVCGHQILSARTHATNGDARIGKTVRR